MMGAATNRALGEKLGSGRRGIVYRDAFDPRRAVKVLRHPTFESITRIEAAIAVEIPPVVPGTRARLAWPTDLQLNAAGLVCGFAMPIAAGAKPVLLASALDPRDDRGQPTAMGLRTRLQTVAAAAALVGHCHDHRALVGDLHARDLMVSSDGWLTGIGCDSFRFRGVDGRWHGEPDVAPDLDGALAEGTVRGTSQGFDQDRFALATFIFGLLHPRLSAIAAQTTATEWNLVPRRLATLLETTLTEGAVARSPVSAWELHDGAIGALGDLSLCDGSVRHFFPQEQPTCPWCSLARTRPLRRDRIGRLAATPPPPRSRPARRRPSGSGRLAGLVAMAVVMAIAVSVAAGIWAPSGPSAKSPGASRLETARTVLVATVRHAGVSQHAAFTVLTNAWRGTSPARTLIQAGAFLGVAERTQHPAVCRVEAKDPERDAALSAR